MIRRPAVVDILFRKPCFLARLILLGWNVLFIFVNPYVSFLFNQVLLQRISLLRYAVTVFQGNSWAPSDPARRCFQDRPGPVFQTAVTWGCSYGGPSFFKFSCCHKHETLNHYSSSVKNQLIFPDLITTSAICTQWNCRSGMIALAGNLILCILITSAIGKCLICRHMEESIKNQGLIITSAICDNWRRNESDLRYGP